jgi:hypothetical protein
LQFAFKKKKKKNKKRGWLHQYRYTRSHSALAAMASAADAETRYSKATGARNPQEHVVVDVGDEVASPTGADPVGDAAAAGVGKEGIVVAQSVWPGCLPHFQTGRGGDMSMPVPMPVASARFG